jgi:uncharacterized protein YhaN
VARVSERIRVRCVERLDAVPARSVRSRRTGVLPIPDRDRELFDFARLEHAVEALSDAHRRLRRENAGLRRKVEEKARQVRSLEERMIEANQKRQDVAKRIDELVAQLDHLDTQLARAEE